LCYGLVQDLYPDRDGMITCPEGPGLGAKIDFELIERKKTSVLA
jgi:L-alanine-DL-glutamate epimerase-like enolase superfamily enzyme